MVADADPHELLLATIDQDANGKLETVELFQYFEAEAGEDLTWDVPVTSTRAAYASEGQTPTYHLNPGDPAPDFSLAPPDGGDSVRLSSFKGSKPVALIFGSYT
jgi:hypothetical protein